MAQPAAPAALLDATVRLIEAGPAPADQLEAGLDGLVRLLDADRADAGFVSSTSTAYRPDRVVAVGDTAATPFEVSTDDPMLRAVLAGIGPVAVADVEADLATGAVRDLLVATATGSIVVRRLDHLEDGCGVVCIDWVDRRVELPAEALELVDYFVARIWSPLLARALATWTPPRPEHRTSPAIALTPSERDVVRLAASGLSYAQIAGARGSSTNTVGQQLRSARRKVGARNTAELCSLVVDHGLLDPTLTRE